MKRRDLIATGCISLTTVSSGCLNFPLRENEDKPWVAVSVVADNVRVGFDTEQVFEVFINPSNLMGRQLPDENQEHHIRIDVSTLEQYGVNIEDLSVETTQGKWGLGPSDAYNNNVDSVDITDGVIELLILTSEDVSETDPIALKLTGYQFTNVESVTEIQYDVQSPEDHVEINHGTFGGPQSGSKCGFTRSTDGEFTLVDPQLLSPTLCPSSIDAYRGSHQNLDIEWLTPEADEVVIEIDISVLDKYGTIGETVIEPLNKRGPSNESRVVGATLDSLSIDEGTISIKLVPDPGTNYASVSVRLSGMDLPIGDPVRDISYEMTIEGDVDETVETGSFDITDNPPDPNSDA